jgi:hypothetical protein
MMRKAIVTVTVAAALVAVGAAPAHADLEPLPGQSRVIDTSLSASRDTFAIGYAITPYTVLTAGGDLAFVGWRRGAVELRVGFVGMLELQSERPIESGDLDTYLPNAGLLWRGRRGPVVSLASSSAGAAIGADVVEATLSQQHESAHFTGSRDGNEARYPDVVIVGDFVRLELAGRWRPGRWTLDARVEGTAFIPDAGGHRFYDAGAATELIATWAARPRLHPFASLHVEGWIGADTVDLPGYGPSDVPSWYTLRQLAGVAIPGARAGTIAIFASLEIGHGHGLLLYEEEVLLGGGVRFALQ